MYKKHLTFFGVFLFVTATFVGFSIWQVTEKDRAAYETLLESSTPPESPLLSYSQHAREGVLKEIWYQDKSPLYIRIESHDSQLFFFHQEGQIEVVEELEAVTCIMQEELYYDGETPMQTVRLMKAKHASYNYNTHLFTGSEAKLWKYRLEGHEPVFTLDEETPTMSGTADSVTFTMKGKDLDFHARGLKATFNPNKEL